MYQNAKKEKFIREYHNGSYSSILKSLFLKTEEFERKLGKDISTFEQLEFEEFLSGVNWSYLTIVTYVSKLRLYTQWCREQGLIACANMYEKLDNKYLLNFTSTRAILTYHEILSIAEQLENPSDCFILLAFVEGLSSNEIANLTIDHVNVSDNIITLNDREIEVSDMLIQYALKAHETDFYYSGKNILFLHPSRHVVRCRVNVKSNRKGGAAVRINGRFYCIRKKLEMPTLSAALLKNSGIAHYTKKLQAAENLDKHAVTEHHLFEEIKSKYNLHNRSGKDYIFFELSKYLN